MKATGHGSGRTAAWSLPAVAMPVDLSPSRTLQPLCPVTCDCPFSAPREALGGEDRLPGPGWGSWTRVSGPSPQEVGEAGPPRVWFLLVTSLTVCCPLRCSVSSVGASLVGTGWEAKEQRQGHCLGQVRPACAADLRIAFILEKTFRSVHHHGANNPDCVPLLRPETVIPEYLPLPHRSHSGDWRCVLLVFKMSYSVRCLNFFPNCSPVCPAQFIQQPFLRCLEIVAVSPRNDHVPASLPRRRKVG